MPMRTEISLLDDEYAELDALVSWAYSSNYYHNRLDTDTFDSMSDKIEGVR